MSRIPVEKRVDPIGRAPITGSDGVATPFYARQWQNLIDLVKSVLVLQDDSASNAARITVLEGEVAVLEATEIGGDNVDIQPAPAPLSAGNITLNLSDTAVTPATYGDASNVPQITVDQKGRVTGVVDVPISFSGVDVEDEGVAVVTASTLNFVGAGVTATDVAGVATVTIPGGGGGGGSAWTFVSSTTIALGTTNVDITGLAAYNDLLVILDNSTASTSQARTMRVSVDNGVTFLTTSGDYQIIGSSGSISNQSSMAGSSATAAARSAAWLLINKNSAENPKVVQANSNYFFIRTASAIDAIQVRSGTVGTIDSGTLLVYGR